MAGCLYISSSYNWTQALSTEYTPTTVALVANRHTERWTSFAALAWMVTAGKLIYALFWLKVIR